MTPHLALAERARQGGRKKPKSHKKKRTKVGGSIADDLMADAEAAGKARREATAPARREAAKRDLEARQAEIAEYARQAQAAARKKAAERQQADLEASALSDEDRALLAKYPPPKPEDYETYDAVKKAFPKGALPCYRAYEGGRINPDFEPGGKFYDL